MSKPENNPVQDKIVEFPLPNGTLPNFGEITPEEFEEFLKDFPVSEERKKGLLERFIERKKKLES